MSKLGYCGRVCCLGILLVNMAGCVGDLCGDRVLSDVLAPGNGIHAVVFERDCGATTGFSTQVSILDPAEGAPHEAGNVFAADTNHGAVADLKVNVRWNSGDQLIVTYANRARVFFQVARVKGVNISYEKTP